MTRKDYEAIAKCISNANRHCETDNQRRGVERVRNEMAGMLASENPQFDRHRFMVACSK